MGMGMGYHQPPMQGGMQPVGHQGPRPITNHSIPSQQQQQQQQQQQSTAVISRGPRPAQEGMGGPSVTVFVGNITDRAPDNMVRQILQHSGTVVSWKRVQGASGVLQGRSRLVDLSNELLLQFTDVFSFVQLLDFVNTRTLNRL